MFTDADAFLQEVTIPSLPNRPHRSLRTFRLFIHFTATLQPCRTCLLQDTVINTKSSPCNLAYNRHRNLNSICSRPERGGKSLTSSLFLSHVRTNPDPLSPIYDKRIEQRIVNTNAVNSDSYAIRKSLILVCISTGAPG